MAAAGALSFGMMGVFALPAYATVEVEGQPDGAPAQRLYTAQVEETVLPIEGPTAEIDTAEIQRQQREADAQAAEEREQAQLRQQAQSEAAQPAARAELPAGAGAQGLLNAAMAQLGWAQDCTALVENSLRAVGIPAGDLGTQIGEYTGLGGTLVTSGDYAPGDVLIWSGRHVAVYIGNGQAVHGGYGGNQTVVASAFIDGAPSGVVRFG